MPISDMPPQLSQREREVFEQLKCAEPKQAAHTLGMSRSTLNVHRHRIKKKYKEARKFVNWWESQMKNNENLKKYFRTREF